MVAKCNGAFEGSNEVRHINKSSVNVANSSSETKVEARRAFARTKAFSAEDIGFVTVDPAMMTSDKSGVTYDITQSLENRSTNLDGDPTFFNGTNRGSTNSAVDVIPVVTAQHNGLMSPTMLDRLNNLALVRNGAKDCTNAFTLRVTPSSTSHISTRDSNTGIKCMNPHDGGHYPWLYQPTQDGGYYIGVYGTRMYMGYILTSRTDNGVDNWLTFSATELATSGTFTASKVYNAVWNDYAELFERGSKSEAGDIIMLDIDSNKEQYCIARRNAGPVVGVHSDTYAQLIGGEKVPDDQNVDHAVYNMPRYIPIGLAGRVNVKVMGDIKKGQKICLGDIPGVGRAAIGGYDDDYIIGVACEEHTGNEIDRIKMFIKM